MEDEGLESGPAASGSANTDGPDSAAEGAGNDPIAMAMAFSGARREAAEAFLHDQRALIKDQRHYLNEKYKRLVEQVEETGLRLWELRLGNLLRASTLVIGLAVAAGIGALVWDASHSRGLVIEPFSVPPDLAAKGVTGQVVAALIQDRLAQLQEATDSSRIGRSYVTGWGDDIKVEIPETGISIGELRRYLREWLGHDTHIGGEIYRTKSGIAVTARAGGGFGMPVFGPEDDLDTLIEKAAERVYGETQPARYANFLDRNTAKEGHSERIQQAGAIYRKLIEGPDALERAWAWYGLAVQIHFQNDNVGTLPYFRNAIAAWPDFAPGYFSGASHELFLDRKESALNDFRTASKLLDRIDDLESNQYALSRSRISAHAMIAYLTGDYVQSVKLNEVGGAMPSTSILLTPRAFQIRLFESLAKQHDGDGVRAKQRDPELQWINHFDPRATSGQIITVLADLENWAAIVALEKPAGDAVNFWNAQYPDLVAALAYAKGRLGDMVGAESLIAKTPGECDSCLIAHAKIAEIKGEHARADWWFARAQEHAPSIPFAYADWGQALLNRGQPDLAIAKFKVSNQKGPHFADPLEGWGEALMAKNQSHRALAKFAEAEKYAPNWGRLHLKWGEALVYAGKKDQAKAQFARAVALDLTPSEKAELAQHP